MYGFVSCSSVSWSFCNIFVFLNSIFLTLSNPNLTLKNVHQPSKYVWPEAIFLVRLGTSSQVGTNYLGKLQRTLFLPENELVPSLTKNTAYGPNPTILKLGVTPGQVWFVDAGLQTFSFVAEVVGVALATSEPELFASAGLNVVVKAAQPASTRSYVWIEKRMSLLDVIT